jgi:signal transduction histidine kinase
LCEARPTRFFPSSVSPGIDLISADMEHQINNRIDSIDIQQIYNDYGIFSRNLAQKYVSYKYNQLIPINTVMIPTPGYLLPPDLERIAQFTKMVLSGPALYRTLAHQMYSSTFVSKYFTPYQKIWQPYASKMLELIRKRSNDTELNAEIDLLFRNQLQWTNTQYIPETQFLNLKQQKVSLQSVIAGKPAIVFISDNWSTARYEMDETIPKFPGFNFVLINEGTNFDLWKDWSDRAESLSHQLFLLNDSIHLADIFQEKQNMFLVYNAKGERIGVEHEMIPAIQLAKDSLKAPKKEINKSTLQGIIIVLVASMLFFLILFLAYKYRMKQRLKKQEQEKRLRELQMAAIRAQMNPHFLFNSLNSVQNLIQQNRAGEAHLYLSNFAGLIRKVLRNSDKEEVSLAEELETLEQYLNLEKLRFDFDYAIEVDEGIDQNLFMLPAMILQPLAENALMHGLQHKTGDKKLKIRFSKINSAIRITIEDNGIGIEEARRLKTKSNGVGLRMNEERIQMMKVKYGGNYSFRLIDLTEQGMEGTRAEIVIPEEN